METNIGLRIHCVEVTRPPTLRRDQANANIGLQVDVNFASQSNLLQRIPIPEMV